ncbi:MAG: DUF1460 domain-containing protein, partial [Bacteroidota bacterium]|nr:DUF1460 domain-containing protein [Bacteroidota bacterium]
MMCRLRLLTVLLLVACYQMQLAAACDAQKADIAVFNAFLVYAKAEKLSEQETGACIVSIGKFFLNTPYVGGTLEAEGPERLQVNLRELDCTTFVENVLALHLTLKAAHPDFQTFRNKLLLVRYRDGKLDGYPSRLHYTSDWIGNNEAKGFVKTVYMGDSAVLFKPDVGYMSAHPDAYPALKTHPAFVQEMAAHEARINQMINLTYVPKGQVRSAYASIKAGDIIAITTSAAGLDYAHMGLAVQRDDGQIYLLHASSAGKKVMISEQPLWEYLSGIKK